MSHTVKAHNRCTVCSTRAISPFCRVPGCGAETELIDNGGTMPEDETFTNERGIAAILTPAPFPDGPDGDDFEWFAEGPGQRPPQFYEMRSVVTNEVVESFVVYPVEPWSPYDAAYDKLVSWGWTRHGGDPEPETCEHGLSANLCAGPGHYPADY